MLDICCVNFNTADKLKRFLETVNQSNPSLWNLYVADNGSTDGSIELLKENLYTYNIEQGYFNENIGFANACNQLASLGNADIIGLFNADVWLMPNHVDYILKSFADNPNMAIMGPKQRNEQGQVVHAGIFGSHTKPRHRGWRSFDPHDQLYRDYNRCLTVSGSAYFIRRSVWDALTNCEIYQKGYGANGAFLPTPHYYEETYCSVHALSHGYEVWYDGRFPSLGHSWHASSEVGGETDAQFGISQMIFRSACDMHSIPHD